MRAPQRLRHCRALRKRRTRSRVRGTVVRPRLSVFRSNRLIAVQLIDDTRSTTIAAASDRELARSRSKGSQRLNRRERAAWVGATIAARARERGIAAAVFDRGSYRFHGLIAEVARGARAAGLRC